MAWADTVYTICRKICWFLFLQMEQKMPSSPWTSLSSSWFELLVIFCYRNFFWLLEHSPYSSVFWWLTIKKKPTHCVIHYCSKSAIEVMACAIKQSSKDSGCVWSLVATVKSRWHPLGIFHLQTKYSLQKLN